MLIREIGLYGVLNNAPIAACKKAVNYSLARRSRKMDSFSGSNYLKSRNREDAAMLFKFLDLTIIF